MDVKNPRLYAFLKHFFKKVKVQNVGSPFIFHTVVQDGKKSVKRIESGEEYAICCPQCGDDRYRLNVSYVFGEYIEGVPMTHTVHCWNENCDVSKFLMRHYEEFCELTEAELNPVDVTHHDGPVSIDEVAAACKEKLLVLPGVVRVDTLVEDHPAWRYLRGRRFDPKRLGAGYGIGYFESSEYGLRMAHKRLIIPVLYGREYVGWQARAIEGWTPLTPKPNTKPGVWPYREPKYWTSPGSRVSNFLYSYDLAATQESVIVMEGPTDAWRAGSSGVSIFGRRISLQQRHLIADTWGEKAGWIILIGDPGFEDDWRRNYEVVDQLVGEPGKVKLVLPKDRDPGDMTYEEIMEVAYGS